MHGNVNVTVFAKVPNSTVTRSVQRLIVTNVTTMIKHHVSSCMLTRVRVMQDYASHAIWKSEQEMLKVRVTNLLTLMHIQQHYFIFTYLFYLCQW